MDKEFQQQQQKEELRKKKVAFEEIRNKFNSWRFNMYLCLIIYIIFFAVIQSVNNLLIKEKAPEWLNSNEILVVIIAAIILGICFIGDSIVTSYLKTPLQRLALKIDISPMEDKQKSHLMRVTQETNELFKETLIKFGILVIPGIVYSVTNDKKIVVDEAGKKIGTVKSVNQRSEWMLFNICYLIPVIFATWRIIQFSQDLKKIEQRILNEQKKHYSS